jgi:hypothetical protein
VLSVLVLVAALCLIGLVTVQYLELAHYSAAPSVWPQ